MKTIESYFQKIPSGNKEAEDTSARNVKESVESRAKPEGLRGVSLHRST